MFQNYFSLKINTKIDTISFIGPFTLRVHGNTTAHLCHSQQWNQFERCLLSTLSSGHSVSTPSFSVPTNPSSLNSGTKFTLNSHPSLPPPNLDLNYIQPLLYCQLGILPVTVPIKCAVLVVQLEVFMLSTLISSK